jgi:hypothetical protein
LTPVYGKLFKADVICWPLKCCHFLFGLFRLLTDGACAMKSKRKANFLQYMTIALGAGIGVIALGWVILAQAATIDDLRNTGTGTSPFVRRRFPLRGAYSLGSSSPGPVHPMKNKLNTILAVVNVKLDSAGRQEVVVSL